jgi:hypothetical protein
VHDLNSAERAILYKPCRDPFMVAGGAADLVIGKGKPLIVLAGVGGGAIAGTVLCPTGGAELIRRARENLDQLKSDANKVFGSNTESLSADITQRLGNARATSITAIRAQCSLSDDQAQQVFDTTLTWMRDNSTFIGQMYLALPKQTNNNLNPISIPISSDIVASMTRLANAGTMTA